MLETTTTKRKPQKNIYRDYKIFVSVSFNEVLKHVLAKEKIASCIKPDEIFLQILNKHDL